MTTILPSEALLERVIAGDLRAVSRLISRAESGTAEARPALAEAYRRAGRAHIVGITGVPGSGKSTLVSRLTTCFRHAGRRVAVIAIDPSSPYSGGAILGDRVRMQTHALDPGVFIRSMATRGATGGLAGSTLASADVLDLAGFDPIVIETVGVGQDEVEIARAAHTTVVVSAPGLGDDIQAIKAGILEIADIHVVSKCDRTDADRTIADLKSMLALATLLAPAPVWQVPVLGTSAEQNSGIDELAAQIDQHRAQIATQAHGRARRYAIAEYRARKTAEELLRQRFAGRRGPQLEALIARLAERELDPYAGAEILLNDRLL